ncbi:hypothetical protein H2200_005597 [Cladophialophora chaetospira]|uniref:Major facilitator superfamily (MFS) profile domain-containing protein n=1 Tax=Cladophialophora chaetospira TaxID=386627 RepID=A0AA38XCB0_9EURO|nr:hypothetical protein H2200_005597 [Cladophialophora chaetospira]
MPAGTAADDLERSNSTLTPDRRDPTAMGDDLIVEKLEPPPALDWDGPDDPGNAQNWSKWKKALHIYVFSMLGLATTVGVSSYSPAIGDVAERFHVSHVAATIPLTLYVLGQALGPCLAAPISETCGRKSVFITTTPLGLLFAMGAGFSHNYGSLCILRFLAGLFCSPSLSVGGGIIADMLNPIYRSVAIAFWVGVALLGTALGPILAGFAVQNESWRWSQWVFIFATLTGWIPSLFTSESYKKIILQRRARLRSRAEEGVESSRNPNKTALSRWQAFASTAKFFLTVTLFRPFALLVQEPIVASFSIYLAVIFAVLFSFFEAFPIVFAGVYKFNLGETGLSFFGLFIGVTIGMAVHIFLDRITYYKKMLARQARGDFSSLQPEERLYAAMLGAPLITISMFWFGWTSRADVHWISAELATMVFGIGAMGVLAPCLQYRESLPLFRGPMLASSSVFPISVRYMLIARPTVLEVYGPLYGASAVGANNLLRYAAGAVSPLYTRQMYAALGIDVSPTSQFNAGYSVANAPSQWAVSLLAFATLALLPVPFVLFKYGEAIRARSRYKPAEMAMKPE